MISLLAATLIATYSCEVGPAQSVRLQDGSATAHAIVLPPEMDKRNFTITLSALDEIDATINWPNDPMQISGKFPALQVGGGAYAFSTFAGGPCLFTETSCLSQVTVVDSGDSTANVVIVPSAITFTDETKQNRSPFIVILQGTCARSGPKK